MIISTSNLTKGHSQQEPSLATQASYTNCHNIKAMIVLNKLMLIGIKIKLKGKL